MIKITNLNKYFYKRKNNEIHVINDMTLEFPSTGLVTIFGESGSGKTTLMNVVGGLDKFDSGSIQYDDLMVKKYSSRIMDRIRNEKIGYIFQNYLLLQHRTVYDNLKLQLNMYNINDEEKNDRIDYVLKSVGMMKYKKKNVSELSGGQQQRVAIARALIKSPSVILADEPTGNLDEKNTIQIMNIIKKISEKVLVILVSHEKRIAKSYSDYIIEVSDGKIDSVNKNSGDGIYHYEDDQSIYLKEYQYKHIETDQVNIDFYSNDNKKINLQIVYENGKFLIKSDNDIVYLDNRSETKFIDDYKKALDTEEEVSQNNYELKQLKYVKDPKLSAKEIYKLAMSNLTKVKKRTLFLAFPLIAIIVLVLFSVNSVISASFIDYRHLVYSDSRIFTINLEKGYPYMNSEVSKFGFSKFYDEFREKNPNIEPVQHYASKFYFNLPDFSQLDSERYEINGFSFLSTEHVSKEQLIYGRMPENASEIVVEKWVLENALENTTAQNFMDVSSFINKKIALENKEVTLKDQNNTYTIVGIADNDQNTIYVNKWVLFTIYPSEIKKYGFRLISHSELEKLLEHELSNEFSSTDIIANYDNWSLYVGRKLSYDTDLTYTITKQISFNGFGFDIAVPDDHYDNLVRYVSMSNYDEFEVFCETEEEKKQVMKFVDSVKGYYASGELKATEEFGYDSHKQDFPDVKFDITYKSKYDNIADPVEEEMVKNVLARLLITITIIVISIIIVFFTMKSYAIKNIYDIGVFRAIGIKKSSLTYVYGLEILIISLLTTFIGGTLCYLITNVIAGIPIISTTVSISLPLYLGCTFGMVALNVLVGVLPVNMYMRLTPSQILTKYDI